MQNFWHHAMEISQKYGVDPVVFFVLYMAHHPLFWGTMACLVARVRAKKPVRAVIALAAFFWLMPYLYILISGKNLPPWIYAAVAVVLAIGGTHVVQQIKARLKAAEGRPS